MQIVPRLGLVVFMALLLSGCSGFHVYQPEEHALATQAKEQYDSIELLTAIATERENLDAALEYELIMMDRLVDLVLQREWFRLVSSSQPMSESFMATIIDERKATLGVDQFDSDVIIGLIRLEAELQSLDRQLNDARRVARRLFGVNFPICGKDALPDSLPASTISSASNYGQKHRNDGGTTTLEMVLYPEYRNKCADRNQQLADTLSPFDAEGKTGLLPRAVGEWQRARLTLIDEKNQALEAKAAVEQTSQQIKNNLEAQARSESIISEEIAKQSGRISELLEQLESKGGAVGLSEASAERIRNIDTMLSAIVSAEVDERALTDPSTGRSAVVLASLSSLSSEVKTLYSKRSLDPVGPLIIEKERQLVLQQLANVRVARMEQRVELLRQRYIAVTDELELIRTIETTATLPGVDGVLANPASDALARNCRSEACAEVYRMLLKYVEMVDSVRRRLEKIDYQLIDLDHRIALDESAAAIGLWNAMIETPLDQLAAYYESGYSTEALADTIVTLTTLGAIAVGVNR